MPYYDKQTGRWHEDKSTLPNGRGQTIGLRSAPDELLATLDIIAGVVDAVPEGMLHQGGYTVSVIDGVAHRVPVCITEAEATQAEAQRIAALAANPVYRAMIDELQADLVTLGLSIPTDETAVMVRMAELKAAGQWTDEHRRAKASIGVTWTAIKSAGITDDVRAIWAAMQVGE